MTTTLPTIKGFAWDVSKATHVVNPALNMSGTAIATGDWMVLVWSYQAATSLRPPTLAAPWRERIAPVGFGTMGWALWSGIRGAADTTYTIPTVVGNTNTPNWMLVWGSGPGPSENAWVQGATGSRAGQPTQFEATAPSITAPEGSLVLVVGAERTGGTETLGTIVPDNGFTSFALANPTTSTPYVAYKSYPNGGATGNTKVVWPFSHANNAQILQLAIPGVPSTTKFDPTGMNFWNPATGSWVTPSRGNKGDQGVQGSVGAAASERATSVAYRALGASHTLNPGPGWTNMEFSATPMAGEVNSPIVAQNSAGSPFWRFLKTGAYLVTVTMWLNAGSPPVGGRASMVLFRNRPTENLPWAQNAFGQNGQGAQTLTSLVLAQPSDSWYVALFRSAGASSTHSTDMYVAPVGPCRTGVWDYATISDHADYNSGGSTVTVYSITPPNTTVTGDWLYLVHMNYYSTTNPVVTPPVGWELVVPQQARYTSPEGISFGIWRRKFVPGDICNVNLSLATYVRATLLVIRQANDDLPTLSAFVAPRGPANPSKITVPGGVINSSSVSIAMQHVPNQWVAPPPACASTASPGGYWFTAGAPTTENLWLCTAWQGPPRSADTEAVVDFNFPAGVTADAGQINGITLSWPRILQP